MEPDEITEDVKAKKKKLNNVERLERNRGVKVKMLYEGDKHMYAVKGAWKRRPYKRAKKAS